MPSAVQSSSMKPWRLQDLIDFDYTLDAVAKSGDLGRQEHRECFLQYLESQRIRPEDAADMARHEVFLYWLQSQRRRPPLSESSPGTIFQRAIQCLRMALIILALASGSLMSATLLRYDGTQPTNVAGFLFVLLGGQLVLLLAAGVSLMLRRFGFLNDESGLIGPMIRLGLSRLVDRFKKHASEHIGAETKLRLQSFLGTLGKHKAQYHSLITGKLSGIIQLFGISFNIAAITTTLLLVTVSDRAFGWQSTLELSTEQVHQLTQTIASPWAVIFPSAAPSLDEIAGSRIYLKDGIKTLTNQDLVSWWPFLVCSLIAYGLIPRLALWAGSWWYTKQCLERIPFDSLNCDRLWEGMVTRELKTKGLAVDETTPPPRPTPPRRVTAETTLAEPHSKEQTATLIVDPELAKRLDRARTDSTVHSTISWHVTQWLRLPDETESWSDFWAQVEPIRKQDSFERIVIIQEAFQPPIRESIEWLQQLRGTQPSNGKVMIYLVGRPPEAGRRLEVCETNQRIWQQTIDTLKDPNLGISTLDLSETRE